MDNRIWGIYLAVVLCCLFVTMDIVESSHWDSSGRVENKRTCSSFEDEPRGNCSQRLVPECTISNCSSEESTVAVNSEYSGTVFVDVMAYGWVKRIYLPVSALNITFSMNTSQPDDAYPKNITMQLEQLIGDLTVYTVCRQMNIVIDRLNVSVPIVLPFDCFINLSNETAGVYLTYRLSVAFMPQNHRIRYLIYIPNDGKSLQSRDEHTWRATFVLNYDLLSYGIVEFYFHTSVVNVLIYDVMLCSSETSESNMCKLQVLKVDKNQTRIDATFEGNSGKYFIKVAPRCVSSESSCAFSISPTFELLKLAQGPEISSLFTIGLLVGSICLLLLCVTSMIMRVQKAKLHEQDVSVPVVVLSETGGSQNFKDSVKRLKDFLSAANCSVKDELCIGDQRRDDWLTDQLGQESVKFVFVLFSSVEAKPMESNCQDYPVQNVMPSAASFAGEEEYDKNRRQRFFFVSFDRNALSSFSPKGRIRYCKKFFLFVDLRLLTCNILDCRVHGRDIVGKLANCIRSVFGRSSSCRMNKARFTAIRKRVSRRESSEESFDESRDLPGENLIAC